MIWCYSLTPWSLFCAWRESRRNHARNALVYYEALGGFFRLVRKACRSRTDGCVALFGHSLGLRLVKVPQGEVVPGYPALHLGTQQQVAEILKNHCEALSSSTYASTMESLLGEGCARSYFLKTLGREQLFGFVLGLNVIRAIHGNEADMRIVMPRGWDAQTNKVVVHGLELDISKLSVMKRGHFLGALGLSLTFLFAVAVTGISFLKRGIATRPRSDRSFKIASEMVDVSRFSGKPGEPDYLVDGDLLTHRDVLYYVTPEQYKYYLRKDGVTRHAVRDVASQKQGEVVFLDELPVPWRCWRVLLGSSLRFLREIWQHNVREFNSRLVVSGLKQFADYSGLFYHYNVQVHTFLTFPNGHTALRTNSGLVTGVCRSCGVLSASYQTRLFYSSNYEYGFECFDLFCLWGQSFYDMLRPYMSLVERVVFVGDTNLDTLLPEMRSVNSRGDMVAVFPSDISADHHYTYGYSMEFLGACCDAALSLDGVDFVVKAKDPWYISVYRESPELSSRLSLLSDRISFPATVRFDTEELIAQAEVVLAIGFTSPGLDALLAGKKVIYYDGLKCATGIFSGVPGLVVQSGVDLAESLEELLRADSHPAIQDALRPLDPFRDGMARSRILAAFNTAGVQEQVPA